MKRGRDDRTLDLLEWEVPAVAPIVPVEEVRAASLRARISRAVALVLRECDLSRDEVVARMSEFLGAGENVSRAMVDAYASQAREEHTISALRLVALAHATGDMRALQVLVEPLDQAIVSARYLPVIEDALIEEKIRQLSERQKQKRAMWRSNT